MKQNQFRSANEFLYASYLDDVQMVIVFESPEVCCSMEEMCVRGGGERENLRLAGGSIKEERVTLPNGGGGNKNNG